LEHSRDENANGPSPPPGGDDEDGDDDSLAIASLARDARNDDDDDDDEDDAEDECDNRRRPPRAFATPPPPLAMASRTSSASSISSSMSAALLPPPSVPSTSFVQLARISFPSLTEAFGSTPQAISAMEHTSSANRGSDSALALLFSGSSSPLFPPLLFADAIFASLWRQVEKLTELTLPAPARCVAALLAIPSSLSEGEEDVRSTNAESSPAASSHVVSRVLNARAASKRSFLVSRAADDGDGGRELGRVLD
jgi:hypothetical protein